jgi:hypothetical protein
VFIVARRNDGHIFAANAADRAAFERTSSTLASPDAAFRLAEVLLETDDWPTARDRLETERAKSAPPA